MMNILAQAAEQVSSGAANPGAVATPTQTWWVGTFLLMVVWVFVAAAVLGPLIHYFALIRPSRQHFADDRKTH